MLNTNLIHEVELLSVKDRVALMEYLARSVQKELEDTPHRAKKDEQEEPRLLTDEEKQTLRVRVQEELAKYRPSAESEEERRKRLEAIPSFEALHEWRGQKLERGALKELSHLTDDDVNNIITDYLTEKYLK